jgi:hypothetical protein
MLVAQLASADGVVVNPVDRILDSSLFRLTSRNPTLLMLAVEHVGRLLSEPTHLARQYR